MNPSRTAGTDAIRVSPLRSILRQTGTRIEPVDGVEVSGMGVELEALADLSTCDRLGLKGRGVAAWLQAQGIEFPPKANQLIERDDGMVVARYGETEFALADFSRAASPLVNGLRRAYETQRPDATYDVPRAHSQAAFGLCDKPALQALEALCPADLRGQSFARGDVLQTLCSGVSVQLWNLTRTDAQRLVLLCDVSVARHQWAALHDAIVIAGGRAGAQAAWFAR